MYFGGRGAQFVMVTVYVDDLVICCADEARLNQVKAALSNKWKMSDLGQVS